MYAAAAVQSVWLKVAEPLELSCGVGSQEPAIARVTGHRELIKWCPQMRSLVQWRHRHMRSPSWALLPWGLHCSNHMFHQRHSPTHVAEPKGLNFIVPSGEPHRAFRDFTPLQGNHCPVSLKLPASEITWYTIPWRLLLAGSSSNWQHYRRSCCCMWGWGMVLFWNLAAEHQFGWSPSLPQKGC